MKQITHLVLFDADRIKEFVFATGRLKEIRGGSQLVKDASELIRETAASEEPQTVLGLTQEEIVYADGGAGILQFDNPERAQAIAHGLMQHYRTTTQGATLTAIVEEMRAGETFKESKERGDRRLRMAKDSQQSLWQTAHSPFTQSCRSCGARPATQSYTVPPMPEALCDWCYAKRHRSDDLSNDKADRSRLLLKKTSWGTDFLGHLDQADQSRWQDAELSDTTDDLAALSRPANYLGFLYADGNGMGRRFSGCETVPAYRYLSQQVSHSLRAALWLALNHHFPDGPVGGQAPFEVVALGGDDLILLCAAHRVVPVAITVSKLFTRISARLEGTGPIDLQTAREAGQEALAQLHEPLPDGEPMTLSCAAIIAHPKQPILNLEKEAQRLLGRAKRAYPGEPVVDFHVVSSPILRDIREVRRQEYQLDEQTHLTRRPLRLPEAEALLKHVQCIKQGKAGEALPRNKLNALYQALFNGKEAATFEAFFLYYRLRQEHRHLLDEFFQAFDIISPPPPNGMGMPWGSREIKGETQTYTVLADLAELYEFVDSPKEAPDGPLQS